MPSAVSVAVSWPSADTMFDGAFAVGPLRRIKYLVRRLCTARTIDRWLADSATSPCMRALLRRQPRALYPLMNCLLDRRLGAEARRQATQASLQLLEGALGERRCIALIGGRALQLGTLPDGSLLTLGLNGISFHEGLWAINLFDPQGLRLYSISFGMLAPGVMLIGSVQGPTADVEGLARIRAATHAAHGMRPAWLLMHLLRLCARGWGVDEMLGIDPRHHVKGRWNHRATRLRFDYREFWFEQGGEAGAGGHWHLPLTLAERLLADVPSRRRAMYRRRHLLLAMLADDLARALAGLPPSTGAPDRLPPPLRLAA